MPDGSKPPANPQPSGGVAFGMVQADIFRDRTLPSAVKLVYVALATYADNRRTAFPSLQTLAIDTGLSVSSVKRALNTAEASGPISRKRTQTSNRYQLHDLTVGGYSVGSGPEGHTDPLEGSRGPSREVTPTHEQDQTSRPATQTSSTSSDAFAAAGHRASASTDMRIFIPRGFRHWTDEGRIAQHLVAASIAALREAGYEPDQDAADRLGNALKVTMENQPGLPPLELMEMTARTLNLAATGDNEWACLVGRRAS